MEEDEKISRERSEINQEKILLKEIELKQKEMDNNYLFARESLKYQIEDFKDLRREQSSRQKIETIMMFSSVLLIFIFIITAMLLGKDELLSEMIKVVGYIFGGGLTGYGIGVNKAKPRETSNVRRQTSDVKRETPNE